MTDDVLVKDEDLAAIEAAIEEQGGPDLSSGVHACLMELQACKTGMALLDHYYGRIIDDLNQLEAIWDNVEAAAARHARSQASKAATATEIKGLMHEYVQDRPADLKVREDLREARGRLQKVERWIRSLEKRMSAAQSAQNGHEQLGRYGGGG